MLSVFAGECQKGPCLAGRGWADRLCDGSYNSIVTPAGTENHRGDVTNVTNVTFTVPNRHGDWRRERI